MLWIGQQKKGNAPTSRRVQDAPAYMEDDDDDNFIDLRSVDEVMPSQRPPVFQISRSNKQKFDDHASKEVNRKPLSSEGVATG